MIHSLKFKSTLTVLALAMLAACGDGSDNTLRVTGTAATGLAIDGGAVDVKCKSGNGTATTSSAGTYTVGISDGQGPCLVAVTKGSLTLYSIAEFSTSSQAVANVTPITNAIVNAIAAAKGTTVTGLIGTQAPTAAEITAAANSVVAVLNAALVAAGWTGAPLTAAQLLSDPAFTAATATTTGSVLDQALDLLIPAGQTELPAAVLTSIETEVAKQVDPTPTGATGGTGATGSTT